jgi:hypothetical protein
MKKILALLALALVSSTAMADVPDPAQCTVQPADALGGLFVCPRVSTGGDPNPLAETINTVTVKNSGGVAIANASVQILLTALNPACAGAVLTGTTNASGICTITVSASGCADGVPSAGVVKANGVTIRSFVNAKSADYDGGAGNGFVNLSDLIDFAKQFNGVNPPVCHDYTNDNLCNLSDLVVFGKAFSTGKKCV